MNPYRPRVNTPLAPPLDTYKGSGSRDSPYPDRDLNSTDRLWRFHAPGVTQW
ncbi:hypothetical protein OHA79_35635 [Streptomyces sp. NBC_00841]|uniref:hypothetical protein n=1 Tax=unclassified Streptomyces TaxID=2593676 RepID=UPI002256693E|nr:MULTISPECIES: hypothetical protein [unclassified Streptomyces]MCX4531725.1 hypothetical protein [Streptomyces sp. NBC_01669]WSA02712.1 hypothetical protein OHA79_35635 [Streptomyces sp. NBC_00841]